MWYDNTLFKNLTFIFENLYYVSGIALFLMAIKQIRVSKKLSGVSNLRESVTLSVKQCENYSDEVVDLIAEIKENLADQKINFKDFITEQQTNEQSIFNFPKNECNKLLSTVDIETLYKIISLANKLEAFSTYFVSGVAHSETAYKVLGRLFCGNVEFISPYLSYHSEKQNSYLHTKELYNVWKNKLIIEKAEIDYVIAANNAKKHFEPIGTK